MESRIHTHDMFSFSVSFLVAGVIVIQTGRKRKPFATLKHSQRAHRLNLVKTVANELDVPLPALSTQHKIPPLDVLHLTQAQRDIVRSVPNLRMPAEKKIVQLRLELAVTHGTEVSSFSHQGVHGAYVCDPVKYINMVGVNTTWFCIGGDSGAGWLKIGVTLCSVRKKALFIPLIVTDSADDRAALEILNIDGITAFKGDSSGCSTIWQLFSAWSIHSTFGSIRAPIYLNGDWKFINALLGFKSASATFPCPICLIHKDNFLQKAELRKNDSSPSRDYPPLLVIPADRIVPLPLHVFIGLGNRIVRKVLPNYATEWSYESAIKDARQVHTGGGGGRADCSDLNGQEIAHWLKNHPHNNWQDDPTMSRVCIWLQDLYDHLLDGTQWDAAKVASFTAIVAEIQQQWQNTTGQKPFPKLHMLTHCAQFAAQHSALGAFSEARIESSHHTLNILATRTHANQGGNEGERIRRVLSDVSLHTVATTLQTQLHPPNS